MNVGECTRTLVPSRRRTRRLWPDDLVSNAPATETPETDRDHERRMNEPTRVDSKLHFFSYLDGYVVHCKVAGEGHGATGAIDDASLLGFLESRR